MQSREWHHVNGQFSQVCIELSREPETGGDPAHGGADQSVEVPVVGLFDLESDVADVVEGLVVDYVRRVRVLEKLVH